MIKFFFVPVFKSLSDFYLCLFETFFGPQKDVFFFLFVYRKKIKEKYNKFNLAKIKRLSNCLFSTFFPIKWYYWAFFQDNIKKVIFYLEYFSIAWNNFWFSLLPEITVVQGIHCLHLFIAHQSNTIKTGSCARILVKHAAQLFLERLDVVVVGGKNGGEVGRLVGKLAHFSVVTWTGGNIHWHGEGGGKLGHRADGADVGDHGHVVNPVVRGVVPKISRIVKIK